MKTLVAISLMLTCFWVHAVQPSYSSSRTWIEQQCSTNTPVEANRIFVARFGPQRYAAILEFHQGMTLREIIDQSPFKGTTVIVHVLWAERQTSDEYLKIRASEKPKYKLKNLDVILLYENGPIITS
jgi:hypothetical protein